MFVVCHDEISRVILSQLQLPNVVIVPMHSVEERDDPLLQAKSNRTQVEYYWTATPTIILWLLANNPEVDVLTYLDADLYFFSSPDPIFAELGQGSVLIHEHRFPNRLLHLEKHGKFNVGLLSFRNNQSGLAVLCWWRQRCLEWCHGYVDGEKYGDQAYLDRWPEQFSEVVVLKHPGAGLAPWNHENYEMTRNSDGILRVDGLPVVFYHFHSFAYVSPEIVIPTIHKDYFLSIEILRLVFLPYVGVLTEGMARIRSVVSDFSFGLGFPKGGASTLQFLARNEVADAVLRNLPQHRVINVEEGWVAITDRMEAASARLTRAGEISGGRVHCSRDEVQDVLRKAEEYLSSKNVEGARAILGEALRVTPDSTQLLIALGNLEFHSGDYQKSHSLFTRATEVIPDNSDLLLKMAAASVKLKQFDEFNATLNRALELEPQNETAHRMRADHEFRVGNLDEAARGYKWLLKRKPDDLELLMFFGVCCFKSGNMKTAEAGFERILELQPDHQLAIENLEAVQLAQAVKRR